MMGPLRMRGTRSSGKKRKLKQPLSFQRTTVPAGAHYLGFDRPTASEGVDGSGLTASFGIPWPKEEFVAKACKLDHPFDSVVGVSDEVRKAVFRVAKAGPKLLAMKRKKTLLYWKYRASQLQAREDELHAAMPREVANLMRGKRILLVRTA